MFVCNVFGEKYDFFIEINRYIDRKKKPGSHISKRKQKLNTKYRTQQLHATFSTNNKSAAVFIDEETERKNKADVCKMMREHFITLYLLCVPRVAVYDVWLFILFADFVFVFPLA